MNATSITRIMARDNVRIAVSKKRYAQGELKSKNSKLPLICS